MSHSSTLSRATTEDMIYILLISQVFILKIFCDDTHVNIIFENAGVEAGEDVLNICQLSKVNNSLSFSGFSPVLGKAGPKESSQL